MAMLRVCYGPLHSPVLARSLCSLLTKSAIYCLLTVLEEPAEGIPPSLPHSKRNRLCNIKGATHGHIFWFCNRLVQTHPGQLRAYVGLAPLNT